MAILQVNSAVKTLLNPYQGLKQDQEKRCSHCHKVKTLLNPYQGLKHRAFLTSTKLIGQNLTESLSGIETAMGIPMSLDSEVKTLLNPYQGLKQLIPHHGLQLGHHESPAPSQG
ncbi:MAG: hypothetical protein ACLGGO_04550 [Coleofasciculus sp.]